MEDPVTHESRLLNAAEGRAVGSNLAIFLGPTAVQK